MVYQRYFFTSVLLLRAIIFIHKNVVLNDKYIPMATKPKPTWRSKLEKPLVPEIVKVKPNSPKAWGTGNMVIVTPKIINDLINTIPKGKLITIKEMREKFAHDYNADTTCPLTTGIFLRICAETAEEDFAAGNKTITPYWRVIRDTGEMIDKFPGGVEHHAELLKKEGHQILVTGRKGNKLVVANFDKNLQRL
jgi:hypothetical protein